MMCFLGGCISGSKKVISEIRYMHHILGGTLNPTECFIPDYSWLEDPASLCATTEHNRNEDDRGSIP
ncbi:hypothetical protein RND81_02G178800 [Saponaria officinalis]|uniref:Uncharacterized protein n=1 Tax=Saponaria officinalis TaxID=3572 RepID=A0AAW1MME5_SAPOF